MVSLVLPEFNDIGSLPTDLVLVKRYMLRYVQDVRAVIGMGRCLSDHHVVLCKVSGLGSTEKDMLGLLRVRE